ncbi:DUF6600 domain-containing protein [Duganella qianjiadongensis]|uniref:FecR protein domain-containing protein n=1 Tax=Duganella qianjiadongensis TaxID=2692176 RepID=A0ABW9VPV4_9BURK|nr:DUF6600 domain-containing protein [Duganella qianjiadongensis]MYM41441.1 hypothetical protein [Duganella qianjiadongensis]
MNRRIIPTLLLAALASPVYAQDDLPALVGRVAAVQGLVTLTGDDDAVPAGLNWPVVAGNHIHTASGARSDVRAGSTAIRVDGDSDVEILDLDDDILRLRLNYGSVSIRLRSPEQVRNFELVTPQARITLLEPGLLRVDAERQADTSQIRVLAGSARVNGAGASLTLNSGRAAEINSNDVRTLLAQTDGFDRWADERERSGDGSVSTRFVSSGITGYEELDRNGSWTESVEYGPLWTPRNVAADWAPYRDGRWIWLAPWGWTWIDNAPWGYAPSHYGRWVMVNRRWCWAPGQLHGRPVWAPALVGWVDGHGPGPNHRPGIGWYPLTPRDHYVPGYRISAEREQRLSWLRNGRPLAPLSINNGMPPRRDGLSVLPREQFERQVPHAVPPRAAPGLPLNQPGNHALPANAGGPASTQPANGLPPRAPDYGRNHWPERGPDNRGVRTDYRDDGRNRGNIGPATGPAPAIPAIPLATPSAPAINPPAGVSRPATGVGGPSNQAGQPPSQLSGSGNERERRYGTDLNERNDRADSFQRNERINRIDNFNRDARQQDEARRAQRQQDERRDAPVAVQAQPAPAQTPVRPSFSPPLTAAPAPARPVFTPPPAPAAAPKENGQHQREERRKEEGRERGEKRNQIQQ